MNGTELILRKKYAPETLETAPAAQVQKAAPTSPVAPELHSASVYPHGSTFPDLTSLVQAAQEVQKARGDSSQLYVHMLSLMTAQHYGLGV